MEDKYIGHFRKLKLSDFASLLEKFRSRLVRVRVLILSSLHFMKIFFNHEKAKVGKPEKFLGFISCFRHFVLS